MPIIRLMREDDVDQVSQLEEKTFSMPWHKESFLEMIRDDTSVYVVADDEGKIAGTCGIITCVGEGDISNVAVDEAYRRQGIAYEMVATCMKMASDMLKVEEFTLEVRRSNAPAIALYEKLGFVSEGIRPRFYEKPVEDAVIMWKRKR